MIYLASPYTHEDQRIQLQRYVDVLEAKCRLLNMGINVYSPIACWHVAAEMNDLAPGYKTFQKHDEEMILLCERFNILCLPGWSESVGIAEEMKFAILHGKLIEYLYIGDLRHGCYNPQLSTTSV